MKRKLRHCNTREPLVLSGSMVVGKIHGENVRIRILKNTEGNVDCINIDSGQRFIITVDQVFKITRSLLNIRPLAVPLKLYGVRKTSGVQVDAFECLQALKSRTVRVSKVGNHSESEDYFPILANVHCSEKAEDDTNLASNLIGAGVMEMCARREELLREVRDHGLRWLLDQAGGEAWPRLQALLPHPLPLAAGQWAAVRLTSAKVVSEGLVEVGCHFVTAEEVDAFDEEHTNMNKSTISDREQIRVLNEAIAMFQDELTFAAKAGGLVEDAVVGQNVLVFLKTERLWARGVIETVDGENLRVHLTDFDRRQTYKKHFVKCLLDENIASQIVFVSKVYVKCTGSSESVLESLNADLGITENIYMRMERIHHDDKLIASFWKLRKGDNENFVLNRVY